jgi:thiol-disulfide isomerase/thioredoxin
MQRKTAVAALLLLSLLFALLAYQHRERLIGIVEHRILGINTTPHLVAVGEALPALHVQALSGTPVQLAAGRHRLLYLNVFATWCPPCNQEMPALKRLYAVTRTKPLDFAGIDQQEDAARVSAFAQRFAIPYPLYIDRTHLTDEGMGIHLIPASIIVDSQGTVRAMFSGPLTFPQMQRLVASAGLP